MSLRALQDDTVARNKSQRRREGQQKLQQMTERSERESVILDEQRREADSERAEARGTYHRPRRSSIAETLKDRPGRERQRGGAMNVLEPTPLPQASAVRV